MNEQIPHTDLHGEEHTAEQIRHVSSKLTDMASREGLQYPNEYGVRLYEPLRDNTKTPSSLVTVLEDGKGKQRVAIFPSTRHNGKDVLLSGGSEHMYVTTDKEGAGRIIGASIKDNTTSELRSRAARQLWNARKEVHKASKAKQKDRSDFKVA